MAKKNLNVKMQSEVITSFKILNLPWSISLLNSVKFDVYFPLQHANTREVDACHITYYDIKLQASV